MWMPFAQMNRLTPRERMASALNGHVGSSSAVEVRGAHGTFTSLVQNTLDAPKIGSVLTGGSYHAAGGRIGFGARAVKSLFTPSVQTRENNSSIQPGSAVVRGTGAMAGFREGLVPKTELTRLTRSASDPLPQPDNSRALPPATPPPVYTGGSGAQDTTVYEGVTDPAVVTASVNPATMSQPTPFPLAPVLLAGAAVFGLIWYATQKGE